MIARIGTPQKYWVYVSNGIYEDFHLSVTTAIEETFYKHFCPYITSPKTVTPVTAILSHEHFQLVLSQFGWEPLTPTTDIWFTEPTGSCPEDFPAGIWHFLNNRVRKET